MRCPERGMPTPGGEPRIRRLPPLGTARHNHMTPRLGTDGTRMVYPFRGIAQAFAGDSVQRRTLMYVAVLASTAGATVAALVLSGYTLESPFTVVVLGVVAAVAERSSVSLTRNTEQSISVVPVLLSAVLFGPLAAAAVGAASMLGDAELISRDRDRAPRLKW